MQGKKNKINRETPLTIINTKLTTILQALQESDMIINHTPVNLLLHVEPIQSYDEYVNFMVKDVKTYGFVFPLHLYDREKPNIMTYKNNKPLMYEDKYLSEQTGSIESLLICNKNDTQTLYMKMRHDKSMDTSHGSIVRIGTLLEITEHTITKNKSHERIKTEQKITWYSLERNQIHYLKPYTEETLIDRYPARVFDSLKFDDGGKCSLTFTQYPQTNPEISYTLVFQVTPLDPGATP